MKTPAELQEARRALAARCMAIAVKYTPSGCEVHYRKDLSGYAMYTSPPIIYAPRPITRKSLYLFLHECAHHILGHGTAKDPSYMKKLEAECWAHRTMRDEGIAVPREMTKRAHRYVARKVQGFKRRSGRPIEAAAKNYTREVRS